MQIFLDCLPCILRQVREVSKMATDDAALQQSVMTEAIRILGRYPSYRTSPEIVREMHRMIAAHTGITDLYYHVKQRDLRLALRLLPELRQRVLSREDRLYWALKASGTGNMLDSALSPAGQTGRIDEEFEIPFAVCDAQIFRERLKTAKSLLVIGDNTGETVFDCLLLEQFPNLRLTYAVRSAPVINDATMDEALASGLGEYAEVISTGSDMAGVPLDECGELFLDRFHGADIVISKGQGNFETLSDCSRDIFFLLKAKCPVVADLLGVELNGYVFRHHAGETAGA